MTGRPKPRGVFNARRRDAGFSLAEVMVAIVIGGIVGGMVLGALAGLNQGARTTASTTQTHSQLVDAMTHIGRDLSDSSVLTVASPTALETRGLLGGHCVISAYAVEGDSLTETHTVMAETTCPLTGGTSDGTTSTTKIVVSGLTETRVFRYYDISRHDITGGLSDATTALGPQDVREVEYTVGATIRGRKPMVFSSAIRVSSPPR